MSNSSLEAIIINSVQFDSLLDTIRQYNTFDLGDVYNSIITIIAALLSSWALHLYIEKRDNKEIVRKEFLNLQAVISYSLAISRNLFLAAFFVTESLKEEREFILNFAQDKTCIFPGFKEIRPITQVSPTIMIDEIRTLQEQSSFVYEFYVIVSEIEKFLYLADQRTKIIEQVNYRSLPRDQILMRSISIKNRTELLLDVVDLLIKHNFDLYKKLCEASIKFSKNHSKNLKGLEVTLILIEEDTYKDWKMRGEIIKNLIESRTTWNEELEKFNKPA